MQAHRQPTSQRASETRAGAREPSRIGDGASTHQQTNNAVRIKDKVAPGRALVADDRIERLELRGLPERDHVGRDCGGVGLGVGGRGGGSRHWSTLLGLFSSRS